MLPLSEVKDEAFSGELLGKVSETGAEVLIHLGLDTVQLDGKGFTAHVKQGAKVKKGQLLVSVDLNTVKEAGYSLVTPVIITNTNDYLDVVTMNTGDIKVEEELLTLIH